jgi:hypothetical protein
MEVDLGTGRSRVPQGNIGLVVHSLVCRTLDPPSVYSTDETNNKLMSKAVNFAVKHSTHRSRP